MAKPQIVLPLTKGEIPHPFEDDFDIVDNQISHQTTPGEVLRMPGERLHDWEWRKDFVERNRHTSSDINSVILYSKMALNHRLYNVKYDSTIQQRLERM